MEQPLHSGTRFLLYTDGMTEAANADDDLFGIDRLKSTLPPRPDSRRRRQPTTVDDHRHLVRAATG